MLDLLKTFLESIWIDKKYRWIFIFILLTISYSCLKSNFIYTQEEIMPVKLIKLNDNSTLELQYLSNNFTLHPDKKYIFPKKKSKNECERNFYEQYFLVNMQAMLNSPEDKKFIVRINKKFPFIVGEISFYDRNDNRIEIFDTLYRQGDIFDEIDMPIDFCKVYYKRKDNNGKKLKKAKQKQIEKAKTNDDEES